MSCNTDFNKSEIFRGDIMLFSLMCWWQQWKRQVDAYIAMWVFLRSLYSLEMITTSKHLEIPGVFS